MVSAALIPATRFSLEVKAAEEVVGIDGTKYDFVGWSRDYVDNDSYTLMTGDKTYFLDGNEPFREVTYTAIYKPHRLKCAITIPKARSSTPLR